MEVSLANPYVNGHSEKETFDEVLENWTDMQKSYENGEKIWVKFLKGDWKDSIGVFTPDASLLTDRYGNKKRWGSVYPSHIYYKGETRGYRFNGIVGGVVKWPGRRNTKKASIQGGSFSWMKDYDGPPVFEKFDRMAVKEEAMKKPQYDIDGKKLKVGDSVLYINSRYGSGSELCHGNVKEFTADTYGSTYVIIEEVETKQESKIQSSSYYVWKKDE